MSELLFKLNGVPEDEANDVRAILEEHDIAFYETSQGNWGVSLAAIWLPDTSQKEQAEQLLEAYQSKRAQISREQYAEQEQHTFLQRLLRNPLQSIVYLLMVGVLLYVSTVPFMDMF